MLLLSPSFIIVAYPRMPATVAAGPSHSYISLLLLLHFAKGFILRIFLRRPMIKHFCQTQAASPYAGDARASRRQCSPLAIASADDAGPTPTATSIFDFDCFNNAPTCHAALHTAKQELWASTSPLILEILLFISARTPPKCLRSC